MDRRRSGSGANEQRRMLRVAAVLRRRVDGFSLRSSTQEATHGCERAIDSHVKRLRATLGPLATVVETVEGVGCRVGGVHDR